MLSMNIPLLRDLEDTSVSMLSMNIPLLRDLEDTSVSVLFC